MSASLMGRATWLQGVTCPEKMVLVAIADVSDDNGLAYMLIDTLMQKSSLSRRGAQTALAGLVEKGILLRRERRHRSSIFKIVVDAIPLKRPPTSDRELSDDHFWDNLQGAGGAPSNVGVGAGGAPQGAGGAPQGAGGAHILPVSTPVDTPDSPPSLRSGTPPTDLLGDPIDDSTGDLVIVQPTIQEYVATGWSALVADHPRIPQPRAWTQARKNAIATRANEVVKASNGALTVYQVWDLVFAAIRNDVWLRGDADPGRGYDRSYVVEIDHVLRTKGNPHFLKILEKAETNDRDQRATSDPETGREFGPAERSARAALARIRAAR